MSPTEKHRFGQISADYPASPEGMRAVLDDPRFRAMFPNARLVDDRIDFGAGEMVDVVYGVSYVRPELRVSIGTTNTPFGEPQVRRCEFCGSAYNPVVYGMTNCRNCGAPA